MEKPYTELDECPRILLSCFRERNSGEELIKQSRKGKGEFSALVSELGLVPVGATFV